MSDVFAQRWRKLYRHPSTSWQAMPLYTRAFGDELIRAADDDGSIYVGTDKNKQAEVLARVLGAHRSEYKRVAADLALLLQDGFVFLAHDRLWIRNFALAQSSSEPVSFDPTVPPSNEVESQESREERARRLTRERVEKYRAKKLGNASGNADTVTATVTSNADGNGPCNAPTVTSNALPSQTLPSSEEKKREEESRKDAAQNASAPARAPSVTVRKPPSAPSMREVLDTVAEWSNGRLSTILNSADTTALGAIVRQLHQDHRIDLHDWKNFGYWCRKGNPGFAKLERPLTWQWLIGTGDERDGRRIFEAIGEARQWEREQDEKETRRAS